MYTTLFSQDRDKFDTGIQDLPIASATPLQELGHATAQETAGFRLSNHIPVI